jgi:hypothetical protein
MIFSLWVVETPHIEKITMLHSPRNFAKAFFRKFGSLDIDDFKP